MIELQKQIDEYIEIIELLQKQRDYMMKLKGRDYKNKLKLLKITLLNQKINKKL
jgi:hypothetical protein